MRNILLISLYMILVGCSVQDRSECHDVLDTFDANSVARLNNLKEIQVTKVNFGKLVLDREYYGPNLVKSSELNGVSTLISEDIDRDEFFVTTKYYSYVDDLRKHGKYLNDRFNVEVSGDVNFDIVWDLFAGNERFDCKVLSGKDLSLYSFFLDSSLFIRAFRSSDYYLLTKGKVALLDSKRNHSVLVLEDGYKKGFYVLTIFSKDPQILTGVTSQYFR